MRRSLLPLPEPIPHPALSASPTPLLRVLLGESPRSFRALLFGPCPAPGALLAARVAAIDLDAGLRRLVDRSRTAPRRAERHLAARLARVLTRIRGSGALDLLLTAVPLLDEVALADLPGGSALAALQREVAAASAALAADPGSSIARVRLRRAVFAHVAAVRRFERRHDPLRPDRGRRRRVDFSAAAVVAPDPSLPLDRCGIPIELAFGLFELHLAGELTRRRLARTPAAAWAIVARRPPSLLPLLAELVAARPVLLAASDPLSPAPVQAFLAELTEGHALRLSPAAMVRLPAGPDGARIRVFLPLGDRAGEEAFQRLMAPATVLVPGAAEPCLALSRDAMVGLYLASLPRPGARGSVALPGSPGSWLEIEPGRALGPDEQGALRRLQQAQLAASGALRGFFAGLAEIERALDAGELEDGAHVFVRHRGRLISTVAGRCRVLGLLPPELDPELANRVLDRRAIEALVREGVKALGAARSARLVEALEALGLGRVTAQAPSLALGDLSSPPSKAALIAAGHESIRAATRDYEEGLITDLERYHKVIDVWADVTERCRHDAVAGPSKLRELVESGVVGGSSELRALCAMKGLVSKPDGEIREVPILASLGEGLPPHAAFVAAAGVRTGAVSARARARADRRLASLLARALADVYVTAHDCGALAALPLGDLVDAGDLFISLAERARGRAVVEDRGDGRFLAVRSPIFCEAEGGVCAVCCGASPLSGVLPEIGELVGLHAARAIGAELRHLVERTFHICLCAAFYAGGPEGLDREGLRRASSFIEAPTEGVLCLRPDDPAALAVTPDGVRVVLSALEVLVLEDGGAQVPCRPLRRGAQLHVAAGERVARGRVIAEWDSFAVPQIADHGGQVRWEDLREGVTIERRLDEVTGLSRTVVLDAEGSSLRPRLQVLSREGVVLQETAVWPGDQVLVGDGDPVFRGQTLARRPILSGHVPEAIQGRPDLVRLLHAEVEDPALLCEIPGRATVHREPAGACTVTVTPTQGAEPIVAAGIRRYPVARGRDNLHSDGDLVSAGERVTSGPTDPEDLARILGPAVAARYLVDGLQLIFSLCGVRLPTRHAELVVRSLLRFVRVRDPGDGPWAEGELVPRARFSRVCDRLVARGLRAPSAEVAVTGLARRSA